jgi:hypothetical protein
MVVHGERPAFVQPQHLESAVAAEESIIGDRDPRVLYWTDLAVD